MTKEHRLLFPMLQSPVPVTATWVASYLVPGSYSFDAHVLDGKTGWGDLVCDEFMAGRVDGEQKEITRLLSVYHYPLGVIEYDATKTHVDQRILFDEVEVDVVQQRVIFVRFAKPRSNGDIGVFIVARRWSVPSIPPARTPESQAWLLKP